jgi:hypothetical protein
MNINKYVTVAKTGKRLNFVKKEVKKTSTYSISLLLDPNQTQLKLIVTRYYSAVLRIQDILGLIRIRIWIRGSLPRTNGFGCGSCYFRH